MDESIKKKRECKRGYDEKLGENSMLQHSLSLCPPLPPLPHPSLPQHIFLHPEKGEKHSEREKTFSERFGES
jgi:hypothetical protein